MAGGRRKADHIYIKYNTTLTFTHKYVTPVINFDSFQESWIWYLQVLSPHIRLQLRWRGTREPPSSLHRCGQDMLHLRHWPLLSSLLPSTFSYQEAWEACIDYWLKSQNAEELTTCEKILENGEEKLTEKCFFSFPPSDWQFWDAFHKGSQIIMK